MRHKSTPYWQKKVWRHLTRRNTESRRVQSTKARDSKISHIANPALSVTRSNQHYIPSGCLSSVKRPPLVTATLQLISLYAIDLKKWTVCNASTDASCFPHKTKVIVLATLTNKCHTSNQSLRPPPTVWAHPELFAMSFNWKNASPQIIPYHETNIIL